MPMWTCTGCGERHGDGDGTCWSCGTGRDREAYGPVHADVATTLESLASLYRQTGRDAAAKDLDGLARAAGAGGPAGGAAGGAR